MKKKDSESKLKLYVRVEGMYCEHCYNTVTLALKALDGVDSVSFRQNTAEMICSKIPDADTIVSAIERSGYRTDNTMIGSDRRKVAGGVKWHEFLIIAAALILVILGINRLFGYNVFNAIPAVDSNLSYGMLFVTGLLTGIHCISMCGAIGIYASSDDRSVRSIKKPVLYNLGRIISYTFTGGLVGLIGNVLSPGNTVRGIIILVAAAFMLLMSLSMLGLFRFHLPGFCKIRSPGGIKGAFIIGLLNGLMPCGPLQAMQLYALSTGSFFAGAFSMFLFALGTVPLMLGSGALINLTKGRAKIVTGKVASVLILILSVSMLIRGASSLGFDIDSILYRSDDGYITATVGSGIQTVSFDLDYDSYANITVRKNIPVRITIHADESKITGCNNEVVSSDLGFDVVLKPGDNIIEFLPEKEGEYIYTCWMN
ncbi:MAG: sulfite exporter TauE/SafE family protein, partial [Clostridia bacterium]|nr:sulfite exporter TauE/SafE family protein [Clostridia bacterium]